MQFRDLPAQYRFLKDKIDLSMAVVLQNSNYISGEQVYELERHLAEYVGVKHCISCGNGTDALSLALMGWEIGMGDAVFVPDFTFFASAEVVAYHNATPIFVDVDEDTCNIDVRDLEKKIQEVIQAGKLVPKAVIAVDLFGQPADYVEIEAIAHKYSMMILEDSAQGFGGRIGDKKAGSFGNISTTSFFPAKPLGCYGDGGAIFTDNDEWAEKIKSLAVHGKGSEKYDNVRIGVNSRLDTLQAAILLVKLEAFCKYELDEVNEAAKYYTQALSADVKTPIVRQGYMSSWAQYTIQLENENMRNGLQGYLRERGIPSMVYYPKPMHKQKAFEGLAGMREDSQCVVSERLCATVLSLPIGPYIKRTEQDAVIDEIQQYLNKVKQ